MPELKNAPVFCRSIFIMETPELIPHLFRTEYRKIVSVLSKRFGFDQIEIAEDITSETFLTATQTWGLNGTPQNPTAWLYHVAGNKAKNYLQRQYTYENKITPALKNNTIDNYEIDLSPQNINDSQLRMMFAICHPAISTEAQIGLSLRILCGFGIEEIGDAFMLPKETINKRLYRAKEKLRDEKISLELPNVAEMDKRLVTVLATIYLLFNEGYYSASQNKTLRKELCFEAMRLCYMLIENNPTNKPEANALLSMMCFHASRFEARINDEGGIILYEEQDTNLWNADLVGKGGYFLHCSAGGKNISKYHLLAGIAYWNTQRNDTKEKWENILQFYNQLLQMEYSPVAALNRTYALSKASGKQIAIKEAEKLNLQDNYFYFTLLGELYTDIDNATARKHFNQAVLLARTDTVKKSIATKMEKL